MASPIFSANTIPIGLAAPGVPNVSAVLGGWMRTLTFGRVTKTVDEFEVIETMVNTVFQGVWQPFSEQDLAMMPHGQRKWKWFMVHAQIGLILIPDEIITYNGEQYRVKSRLDYKEYGYVQYTLNNDYTGAGPEVETP